MDTTQVLDLLASHKNERGSKKWSDLGFDASGLSSFGIGLTQLRKLAKKIGRNRDLALALWNTSVYDAKVIALLIDEPTAISRAQVERQVEEVGVAQLSHVFSCCGASLATTAFVVDLADDWTTSKDALRRRCGYGLLSEVAKFEGKKAPDEEFFLLHIERIDRRISKEDGETQLSMANALMNVGKRSAKLNAAALKVAEAVGPIEFESPSGRCEPFDVAKHLESERLKRKLATEAHRAV